MRLLLYIVCLLTLFSCTKSGKNISVTGLILNPVTGEGYENIEVELLTTDGGLPGGYKTVKRVYTNEDGYFEMHHLGVVKDYFVDPNYAGMYNLGWYQNNELVVSSRLRLNKGKFTNGTFFMVPYGEFKLNIHNVNCEGATDLLKLNRVYMTDANNSIYQLVTIEGCFNAEGSAAEVPMGYYNIQWEITRSTGTTSFSELVFVPENGLMEYTINY